MTKPALALLTVAVLLGGVLLINSGAAALSGALFRELPANSHPPVQKAGCYLAGRYCGVGFHFVCGLPPNPERRRCHCVPC
jgi:hypothetical protein